jgi:hypothetical protein
MCRVSAAAVPVLQRRCSNVQVAATCCEANGLRDADRAPDDDAARDRRDLDDEIVSGASILITRIVMAEVRFLRVVLP